jgi:hypothetical protein
LAKKNVFSQKYDEIRRLNGKQEILDREQERLYNEQERQDRNRKQNMLACEAEQQERLKCKKKRLHREK